MHTPTRTQPTRALTLALAVLLALTSVLVAAPTRDAHALGAVPGGPVILDGNDPGDHASAITTYMQDVFTNLDANIAPGYAHDSTTAVVGTCATRHLRTMMPTRTFVEYDSVAEVEALFSDIGAFNHQHLHICSDDDSTLALDVETELDKWGTAIAAHVNRGGGLFAAGHSYNWLSDLFPNISVSYGGTSSSYVTTDGAAFFANLNANDQLNAINHYTFTGTDIGVTLKPLLTASLDGAGAVVAIGGATVRFPQITLDGPTSAEVGTTHVYTLTAADADGTALSSNTFSWTLSGTHDYGTTSGTGTTDASGQYTFTFSGTAVGTTTLKVVLDAGGTSAGAARSTTWATIPAAPTLGQATDVSGTSGEVDLAWTPGSDGGRPVLDWLVEHSTDGGTTWTLVADGTSTTSSTTVTGLTDGTAHDFRVAAVNDIGTSAWSTLAGATPVGPTSAPALSGASPASEQVTLSWSTPGDLGGGSLQHYVLQYAVEGSGTWTTWSPDPTGTNATVTGLTDGTSYTFRVAAVNEDGQGPWSTELTGTPNVPPPPPSNPEPPTVDPNPTPVPPTADDGDGDGDGDGTRGGATVDGEPTPLVLTGTSTATTARVGEMELVATPTDDRGRPTGTNSGTTLRVPSDGGVVVEASGMAADSAVVVWLVSGPAPLQLGQAETTAEGTLVATSMPLPDGLDACRHELHVVGSTSAGARVEVALDVWLLASPFPFDDTRPEGFHAPAIGCLASRGVVDGLGGGPYAPTRGATRGEIATMVQRTLGLAPGRETTDFPDVDGTTHARAIDALARAGLLHGLPDGTFGASDTLTRHQLVVLLVAALDLSAPADAPTLDDVGDGAAGDAIRAAVAAGLVTGYADGTFRGQQPVSRGEAATILVRIDDLRADD